MIGMVINSMIWNKISCVYTDKKNYVSNINVRFLFAYVYGPLSTM